MVRDSERVQWAEGDRVTVAGADGRATAGDVQTVDGGRVLVCWPGGGRYWHDAGELVAACTGCDRPVSTCEGAPCARRAHGAGTVQQYGPTMAGAGPVVICPCDPFSGPGHVSAGPADGCACECHRPTVSSERGAARLVVVLLVLVCSLVVGACRPAPVPMGRPAAVPMGGRCVVVLPSADDAAHDERDRWGWLWETVHDVDYRGSSTGPGSWWVQPVAGARWERIGYSAQEDATVYSTYRCALLDYRSPAGQ